MKRMTALIFLAAASAFTLANSTALAHSDEVPDKQKAPHGGQVLQAGAYYFELVVAKDSKEAKENPVVVHVTDHAGTKVSAVGAGGTATILVGKTKTSATLVPDGDNRLKGAANYASTPDMKVVVSIALPGKNAEQARFTPLAIMKDEHTEHKH